MAFRGEDGEWLPAPDAPLSAEPDAAPGLWAWGLRNPFSLSVDPVGGDTWIGDVGAGRWEEINRLGAAEGGLNYGWAHLEGPEVFVSPSGLTYELRAGDRPTPPVLALSHDDGFCAVIVGPVYRAARHPWLRGHLLFTDFCEGHLWAVPLAGSGGLGEPVPVADLPAATGLAVDGEGRIWATSYRDGVVTFEAA